MDKTEMMRLLHAVADGSVSPEDAALKLKTQPFEEIGSYAKVDFHRGIRQGVPEIIYGAGKANEHILGIARKMHEHGQSPILITRLTREAADLVAAELPLRYDPLSKTGIIGDMPAPTGKGKVLVATGGTSDIPVAEEAALTAEVLGNEVVRLYDVGVSGIHRLLSHMEDIMSARVIVAVAGMEGALPSVIGGLADCRRGGAAVDAQLLRQRRFGRQHRQRLRRGLYGQRYQPSRLMELRDFFAAHPRVALAFSGGVDSSYLLYAALQWAESVGVYYVRSAFQPQFEADDALRLARELGASVTVLRADVLADARVAANPSDRCYFCKKIILSAIRAQAEKDGYAVLLDGTNASDDIADRPGWKALQEEGVLSPLRLCGLKKADIRRLSKEAGLFTASKPAYACLATRIPCGETITQEKLAKVEAAESELFTLGFRDFRVRTPGGAALVQVTADQTAAAHEKWDAIRGALAPYFTRVELDAKERNKSL